MLVLITTKIYYDFFKYDARMRRMNSQFVHVTIMADRQLYHRFHYTASNRGVEYGLHVRLTVKKGFIEVDSRSIRTIQTYGIFMSAHIQEIKG